MSDFEDEAGEVRVLDFNKKGSICSATVRINVDIDVVIGYSGTSENEAKDALMAHAFNQLRTNILGEGYE